MKTAKKISIVIPCFNEEKTIREILKRVDQLVLPNWVKEVVIVDDGSVDATKEILKKYTDKFTIVLNDKNKGKGAAVKQGISVATGDYVVIQDADLEYNPEEIRLLVDQVDKGSHVVFGSRNLFHKKREGFFIPRFGAWLVTKTFNVCHNQNLTDVWTCYKLFPRKDGLKFIAGGFEAEVLFAAMLAREGYVIAEVPISHAPRDVGEGKKIRYRDGVRTLWLLGLDRLLHLRKPEEKRTVDLDKYAPFLSCIKCGRSLRVTDNVLLCEGGCQYKIDSSRRPILIETEVLEENSESHALGINWLKSFFKQFPKLYYAIWYTFCPVLMMVNGPKKIFSFIPRGSTILDVGSGPQRIGPEFINVDVFPFREVDIVADATKLPFKTDSIDALVTESLIEHVEDPNAAAEEMTRVIKKGGYIYVSAPFIHPYHASPDDFGRWTKSGLRKLYSGFEIVESGVRSGPWSALLMFLAYWMGVLFSFGSPRVGSFLAHFFMLIFGPFKYLDLLFCYFPGADAVATHLYIIGRKK